MPQVPPGFIRAARFAVARGVSDEAIALAYEQHKSRRGASAWSAITWGTRIDEAQRCLDRAADGLDLSKSGERLKVSA